MKDEKRRKRKEAQKSRRDGMIVTIRHAEPQTPKGWHDCSSKLRGGIPKVLLLGFGSRIS
jgi:hypothetical protein